jgi:trehalose 6-phosphate phosphatase
MSLSSHTLSADLVVAAPPVLPRPPRLDLADALFLDVDGTLAPIAATPDAVPFDAARAALLHRLVKAAGAVAVLSGRSLHDIDRILGGAPVAAAGVHGLVRRLPDGQVVEFAPSQALDEARPVFKSLVAAHPGLVMEDKGVGLALHYRVVPRAAQAVEEAVNRLVALTGLTRQDGDMVREVRTPGPDKGDALKAFMGEALFKDRRPVMVGDDLTDEYAFQAAEDLGGFGILVGEPRATAARYGLADVPAVLAWIAEGLEARP